MSRVSSLNFHSQADSCLLTGLLPLSTTLFSDADALRLALATSNTTTPVTPEALEGVSLLSRGLYAISACECLRKVHISLSPRLFPPVQVLYCFLRQMFAHAIVNDSYTVLSHGMTATLLYANRGLTYTPCLAYSAARILRAGGGKRNAFLPRRF